MSSIHTLTVCASLLCFLAAVLSQNTVVRIPRTRFTCRGRPSGYYADIETGCQVYHMCDGLGRQFSYTCPNTTLFQQRMLVCDHWYMVNCDTSESDYDANLLIGQRDKPFVSEAEMRQRTPRPDILSVPPNNNYFDGLKEAESKFPVHPSNSIVGVGDSISSANNNDLDSSKTQYRPPTSWSTGTGKRPVFPTRKVESEEDDEDTLTGAASQKPTPTLHPAANNNNNFGQNTGLNHVRPPSQDLSLPFGPTTEASDEFHIDARMKPVKADPVVTFIKRFDPNSPSTRTAMTTTEILDINGQLPQGQTSGEDDRTPRKQKNNGNGPNTVQSDKRKGFNERSRFDSINDKPSPTTPDFTATESSDLDNLGIPTPSRELLPPKEEFSSAPTTTVGPPIYYEWKWAVPAFGLEPPTKTNSTINETESNTRVVRGRNPFIDVTRPTPTTVEVTPSNTEYNISSYFVPDYVFPLDNPHPGYENKDSRTSFQVEGGKGYGENPACPHCHPAYLKPGSCEPCIVKR